MEFYKYLLALTPIFTLLLISIIYNVKIGIYTSLAVTSFLFFYWESTLTTYFAACISAGVDTFNILLIISGALLLQQHMEINGYIKNIKQSLLKIHQDKIFLFYFIAIFLTAFFESIAGFGTPGAIVPLILISLGYPPILSVSSVLLLNGLFTVAGALGTPVTMGLSKPLNLSLEVTQMIYILASIFMALTGYIVIYFIQKGIKKQQPKTNSNRGYYLFFILSLFYIIGAYWLQEITGIIATIAMGLTTYLFLFTNKQINWKPWKPYIILILLLILPKILPLLSNIISFEIRYEHLFNTSVTSSIKPLKTPFVPFLITTLFALSLKKNYKVAIKPLLIKIKQIILILFPSLIIPQLLIHSGTSETSMLAVITQLFTSAGTTYPLFSPLIGVLGTFITGSATVSNMLFGPMQFATANNLNLPIDIILGMQLMGASLGNAICLYNIIAAATIANLRDYKRVLTYNFIPVIITAIIVSLIGYLMIQLYR